METRICSVRRRLWTVLAALAALVMSASAARATLPQAGDIALGLSNSNATLTLQLVRGSAVVNGGTAETSPWTSDAFLQSMEFDNFGGIAHNVNGNLLAVNFGTSGAGGTIFSLGTNGSDPLPAGQLIGDPFNNLGGTSVDGIPVRLGGLSISPDNTKIAVTGYDTRRVMVYDYTSGDTMGTGTPALANLRESAQILGPAGTAQTQGTVWKDATTVLSFNIDGDIHEIDATTMAETQKVNVGFPSGPGGNFTSLAYNPEVSPYIYAAISNFTTPTTTNKLYIVDASNYSIVKALDFSTSMQTLREIALDKDGNLFISAFDLNSMGNPDAHPTIEFIANVVSDPAALTDNSSVDWYQSTTVSNFNGLDIGFGPAVAVLAGDYNDNGTVDAADYVVWKDNENTNNTLPNNTLPGPIGQDHYNQWRANFGETLGGGLGGAAVPEPASVALLLIGLAGWALRRPVSRG